MPDATGAGISIRQASAEDWPAVADLHASSWRSAYRGIYPADYLDGQAAEERRDFWRVQLREMDPEQNAVFLAEEEGRAVGFACLRCAADPAGPLLDNLHVLPERKGSGIGSRLLAQAACWLAERDPEASLQLFVWKANASARRFYARLGGVEVEECKGQLQGGGTAPEMKVRWERAAALAQRAAARDRG